MVTIVKINYLKMKIYLQIKINHQIFAYVFFHSLLNFIIIKTI